MSPPIDATGFGLEQLVHPPMRADARRNYDALLVAADELFTSRGPGVALDEIARRAGVGNATLYRHFPERRDLLVAVCVGEVQALCRVGQELQSDPDPDRALARWLAAYVEHVSAKHGLAAALATGRRQDSELFTACQMAIEAVGTRLLNRAKDIGAVRIDVTLPDLLILVNAIARATESTDIRGVDRLMSIILAGIAQPGKDHAAERS